MICKYPAFIIILFILFLSSSIVFDQIIKLLTIDQILYNYTSEMSQGMTLQTHKTPFLHINTLTLGVLCVVLC